MKSYLFSLAALCILFVEATGCVSQKNDVITVPELRMVTRQPMGKSGPALRQYFRGANTIYNESLANVTKNQIVRGYYAGGELIMAESDEDNDGFFETITLFPDDLRKMEVFQRQRDGSVKPLGSKELQELKNKIIRAVREFKDAQKKH